MAIQTDDFAPAPDKRVVSAAPVSPQEEALERALRPKGLAEYVGQAKTREQLEIVGAHVDGVLVLANERFDSRHVRQLEVLKLRGGHHVTGAHEFHSVREWASVQDMAAAAAVAVRLAGVWAERAG